MGFRGAVEVIVIDFLAMFSFAAPPCPFCGGELEIDFETTQASLRGFLEEVNGNFYGVATSPDGQMAFYARFHCKDCDQSMDEYAEHVKAWLVA